MSTFRGLPLSPEQDRAVHDFIRQRTERGEPWDTLELDYMLKDMLRSADGRTHEGSETPEPAPPEGI